MVLEILNQIPVWLINALITLVVLLIIYKIITYLLNKILDKTGYAREKKTFLNIWRYSFIVIIIIFTLAGSSGSLAALGLSAGLMSAALGWALQKPITGVAAWLMLVTKRPFRIGDRVIIGSTKGDVSNITLTHVHLKEFGGTVGGEESSGREILIPNSTLFDQSIINYTMKSRHILDEVNTTITYESDLDKMKEIALHSAEEVLGKLITDSGFKPTIRMNFQSNGIDVKVRYKVIAPDRLEISSKITEKIFKKIREESNIKIAYPQMDVLTMNQRKRSSKEEL